MSRTTRSLVARGLILAVAASAITVTGPAVAANAQITGDQPATPTAVEVFTADPAGGLELAADIQFALEAAQVRAEAKPADLAPPFVDPATGRLNAPTIHETSADAEAPITVDLATLPDEGADVADEPEEPAPAGEVASVETAKAEPVAQVAAVGTTTFYPVVRQVKYSFATLNATSDDVIAANVPNADNIIASYLQEGRNRVIVEANAVTEAMRTALATRYGADQVAIYLSPTSELPTTASRDNDSNPYFGGSAISNCTNGFSWNNGSAEYMLTAGHCTAASGQSWLEPSGTRVGTTTTWDTWKPGSGSVKVAGQNYHVGDASLIAMYGANTSAGRIYTGGKTSSTSRAVGSSGPAQKNKKYCTGGRNKGVLCNWKITQVRANVKINDHGTTVWGRNLFRGTKRGWCIYGGDSGGPVYTTRGDGKIVAKGTITSAKGGGSDHFAGALDGDPCVSWFSEVQLAEKSFPGAITKG